MIWINLNLAWLPSKPLPAGKVAAMKRYAAKLLFQFRVTFGGSFGRRRTCEERVIVFPARSATQALTLAKRKARKRQYRYLNSDGNPVNFQFIGVMELKC